MALRVCPCGRHVRTIDRACPFCGASASLAPERVSHGRRSRAAALACVAAVTVACAARTELGVVTTSSDSDGSTHDDDGSSSSDDAQTTSDVTTFGFDANEKDVTTPPDAHIGDAIDECVPVNGKCTTNADCCDDFCGFGNRCGTYAPPYGAPPVD